MGLCWRKEDLKMRGSGEIFGTRQSGIPEFQVADLVEDYPILEEARKVASKIVATPDWREHPDWHLLSLYLEKERTFRLKYKKGVERKFFGFQSTFKLF